MGQIERMVADIEALQPALTALRDLQTGRISKEQAEQQLLSALELLEPVKGTT